MAAGLSIRMFGPLEVTDGSGTPVDLGTRKQRALLAMLAIEPGRVVSLDRLIQELWAGEPPAGATRTLQAYIAHLRKVLEPGRAPRTPPRVLLTREPGYLLAVTPGQIDLERFLAAAEEGRQALARGAHAEALEILDRALESWRGDPLGEFADQEFAQPLVARLAEVRGAALEDRLDARLALGGAAAAVPDLEALVDDHPYRERAWALLVLALYRAGRQADALAALRRVRERLNEDLALQPGPELRRLEQEVFEQSPSLDAPAAGPARPPVSAHPLVSAPPPASAGSLAPTGPSAPASAGPRARGGAAAPSDGLIARDGHLERADALLGEVRRGRGGVLLVTGEAGIGKSRLAREIGELAASRGFRVARSGCTDGTAPAFWPWTQVLRDAGADGGLLSGEARSAGDDPDAALYELYERVVAELTGGGEPLLVFVDDLHWADVSSLRLLAYVAEAAVRRPLLVLTTLRPEPGDHPDELRDVLGGLSRLEGTERFDLGPFTAADVSSYLRSRGIAEVPDLVGDLLERTGGNPFYLGEVLRLRESARGAAGAEAAGAVPPGAREVIERRVAQLPEETGRTLRALAVAGAEAGIDLLEAVTGTTAEEVMMALEPAVATGLLTEPPTGADYRFSHGLVREALYSGLSRLERSRLHLRVGEALEPVLPAAQAAILARHFGRAAKVGGAAKAVEHAARAARHATGQLAYTEAVEFWELALAASAPGADAERARLLTGLGNARRSAGDATGASRDLDDAFELARRADDQDALIGVITAFSGPTLWNWRPFGVVKDSVVAAIEDLLARPLDDRDRAALLGALGVELCYGPRRAEGERHAAEGVELARKIGDPGLRAQTLNNLLLAAFVPGGTATQRRTAEEMAALSGVPRSTELIARLFLMSCLLRAADLPGWDRELARCRVLLGDRPRPELESMVRIAETARATLDGRWDDAEALVGAFTALGFGSTPWGARFRIHVTGYTCARGRGGGAEMVDDLVNAADVPDMVPLRPLAVLAAAEAGRDDLARDLVARWGTEVPDTWIADFLIPVWGLAAARLGVPDPAEAYERIAPRAGQLVICGMGTAGWGSTHLVLAELAARLGRRDQAVAHAEASLDVHRRLGLSHWEDQSRRLLANLITQD
ncbi:BTAD domain-containing putative transcriptional regulator [Spirillospora sp. NPDC047279]|uniref:BTAD domain-containing putative transcriptional regulator n=1 Tax=Spirillospora sp. NPDC047279 TaxID=3155478 RepID=UPI0033FC1126